MSRRHGWRALWMVTLGATAAMALGCAPARETSLGMLDSQRPLDEIYEHARRVNAEAAPFRLGAGDEIGRQVHRRYQGHEGTE